LIQATNINWLDSQFDIEARKLDKSKPVLYIVESDGGSAAKASSKLKIRFHHYLWWTEAS
jgi:hypothetical protein